MKIIIHWTNGETLKISNASRELVDESKSWFSRKNVFSPAISYRDKKIYLNKFSMNFYLDIQNVYGHKTSVAPYLLVIKDANGQPLTDPNDPTRYQTKLIENSAGIVQPSIGIIIEFANKKKTK